MATVALCHSVIATRLHSSDTSSTRCWVTKFTLLCSTEGCVKIFSNHSLFVFCFLFPANTINYLITIKLIYTFFSFNYSSNHHKWVPLYFIMLLNLYSCSLLVVIMTNIWESLIVYVFCLFVFSCIHSECFHDQNTNSDILVSCNSRWHQTWVPIYLWCYSVYNIYFLLCCFQTCLIPVVPLLCFLM